MAKTKTVQKTTHMWHTPSKGQQQDQESAGSLKRGFFCHFFILSHFLMQKDCQ